MSLPVSQSAEDPASLPPLEEQRAFWDDWNREWRFDRSDSFMARQREMALEVAGRLGLREARILDVGCGTGWLGHSLAGFGEVTATDLSASAIEQGRTQHPGVRFLCGDFLTLEELRGPFDLVVSADALAHFYDPHAFVRRVAELLRPGGTFLLMTQNRHVWLRRSKAKALGRGQIQRFRSLRELRGMLRPEFQIERVSSLVPGGDRGWLWWVERRSVERVMGRVLGRLRYRSLLESLRLGRELVLVARRR